MATSIKMSIGSSNLGSVIQGNGGTYAVASDGTFIANASDVPDLLKIGCVYVQAVTKSYGQTPAVATATVGKFVASTTLANGSFTVAAQPDVPRQGQFVIGAGTVAISAGTISLTYIANDGSTQTDVLSLVTPVSGTATLFTSKGMIHINTPTAAGLVGGATPYIYMSSTSVLSVPVDFNTKDVTFIKETIDTGDEAIGTVNANTLASIQPTVVPNGTHTYSWLYTQNTPDQ